MAFNLLRRFHDKGRALSYKTPTPKSKTIKISSIFLLYHLFQTFFTTAPTHNLDATLKGVEGALQLLKIEDAIHKLLLGVLDPLKIG